MSVFSNSTNHVMHMVGYRADGLKFEQSDPDIPPGKARYINNDHDGDFDWYILVAYMQGASIPDRIGVTQAVEGSGGGGSIGITIDGMGFSIGGSGSTTKTRFFSDGMAACQSDHHSTWWLVEEGSEGSNDVKLGFIPDTQPVTDGRTMPQNADLMGW